MSAAAATNPVTPHVQSRSVQHGGVTVNPSIPVGRMERWRLEAIQKVIGFNALPVNWDGHGSRAPTMAVREAAIDFLLRVPVELPTPRVIPVSGGGYHFEWTVGNRELELSIDPDCHVEVLRVQDGMPIEDDPLVEHAAIFGWLAAE